MGQRGGMFFDQKKGGAMQGGKRKSAVFGEKMEANGGALDEGEGAPFSDPKKKKTQKGVARSRCADRGKGTLLKGKGEETFARRRGPGIEEGVLRRTAEPGYSKRKRVFLKAPRGRGGSSEKTPLPRGGGPRDLTKNPERGEILLSPKERRRSLSEDWAQREEGSGQV